MAVLATTWVTACNPDLSLPKGALVECKTSRDCPSGFSCLPETNRCVLKSGDLSQPGVVAGSLHIVNRTRALDMALAAREQVLAISFTVDSALATSPEVSLTWGGAAPGSRPAALESSNEETGEFVFTYTTGAEEEEGLATLRIRMTSQAGIPAVTELPQLVTFDFTPPSPVPGTTSLSLAPPAGAFVREVAGATVGSTVAVLFATTELLQAGSLAPASNPAGILFACSSALGTFQRCSVTLDAATASLAEGSYDVVATLEDLAGNRQEVVVGAFQLDLQAPPVPDTLTSRQVIYRRIPYGADATEGEPTFLLEAAAGAVEPGATLVVWDRPNLGQAAELGRATADAEGAVASFAIASANRRRVYVSAIDAAGNASDADASSPGLQAALVRSIEWTATLTGKEAQNSTDNPHRLRKRGAFGSVLTQSDATELSDDGSLARIDGGLLETHGAGDWRRRTPPSLPQPPMDGSPVYDSWRGRTIIIGIWNTSNSWQVVEKAGALWEERTPFDPEGDGNPVPRSWSSTAFDGKSGLTMMFGGTGASNTTFNDTWGWNGWSWRQFFPAQSPPPRAYAAMAYHRARGEILLFGGKGNDEQAYGDTWIWTTGTWRKVSDAGPPARWSARMVYDDARAELVLYGGERALGPTETDCGAGLVVGAGLSCQYRDTWVWNGTSWQMRCDSVAGNGDCGVDPNASVDFGFAYDAKRERAVLFAGSHASCPGDNRTCDGTFEWTGSTWVSPAITDPSGDGTPGPRRLAAMAFDRESGELWMLGGVTDNSSLLCDDSPSYECDDVLWSWNGTDWRRIVNTVAASPSAGDRGDAGLVFDEQQDSLLFFGGMASGNNYESLLWSFDGNEWRGIANANPIGRSSPVWSYIGAGSTLLFGGMNWRGISTYSDFWLWNGTGWTSQPAVPGLLGARAGMAFAYNPDDDLLLLYGGQRWLGAPPNRSCGDGTTSGAGKVICFYPDTWGRALFGTAAPKFQQLDTVGFGRGIGMAMAYDRAHHNFVLFGGRTYTPLDKLWGSTRVWTGTAWQEVATTGPAPRETPGMAYDEARAKVVLFGGSADPTVAPCGLAGAIACSDLWEWDGSAWTERAVSDPTGDGRIGESAGPVVTFDPVREVVAVTDGDDLATFIWDWDGGATLAPGQHASFATNDTGEPATARRLDQVEIRWVAGGVGYPSGSAQAGVRLLVWDQDTWREGDSSAAGAGGLTAPADLTWCVHRQGSTAPSADCAERADLDLLLVDSEDSIHAAVEPLSPNGTGDGVVGTDYLELTLRYELLK